MTRNLLYVIALANFDVENVKFIDADANLHNFGCAYEDKIISFLRNLPM